MNVIDKQEIKRLSTLITDRLAEEIESGTLKPGERLIQTDLAERFGVSRVAIRDALMGLRKRGLSVSLPLKGDIVRPVSCRTVAEVFALREVVEGFAVRLATARITEDGLAQILEKHRAQEQALGRNDVEYLLKADWDFHWSIYRHCGNEPLLEVIESLWGRIRQARSVAKNDAAWGSAWSEHSVRRHRALYDAIASRDAKKASRLAEANIRDAAKELIEQLRAQGWDEETPIT